MKFNPKYLPIVIGATFALGTVIGSLTNGPADDQLLAKNYSKTKLNKLIDFINTNPLRNNDWYKPQDFQTL